MAGFPRNVVSYVLCSLPPPTQLEREGVRSGQNLRPDPFAYFHLGRLLDASCAGMSQVAKQFVDQTTGKEEKP